MQFSFPFFIYIFFLDPHRRTVAYFMAASLLMKQEICVSINMKARLAGCLYLKASWDHRTSQGVRINAACADNIHIYIYRWKLKQLDRKEGSLTNPLTCQMRVHMQLIGNCWQPKKVGNSNQLNQG